MSTSSFQDFMDVELSRENLNEDLAYLPVKVGEFSSDDYSLGS